MTNLEAIGFLELIHTDGGKINEALDMAIAALEPKEADSGSITCINAENMHDRTTDDTISRQAAIEALENTKEVAR